MTQNELAAWAKATYRLKRPPAQTTVFDILKMAPQIMSDGYGDGKRRKPLQVTSPELENQLWKWIEKVAEQGFCLLCELIKMKARDIQRGVCDAWDLNFSEGWLTAFERRHCLRSRLRPGEAGSADSDAVATGRQKLQELADLYVPENIYNMDETGLRSLHLHQTSTWRKENKTRKPIALAANADGTDALPALFFGSCEAALLLQETHYKGVGF